MTTRLHRWGALLGLGLVGGFLGVSAVSAGTQSTTNACFNNNVALYTDIDITMSGTGSPNPVLFGSITLGASSFQAFVPAAVAVAAYNIGLLSVGVNNIPVNWWVARSATMTVEGQNVQSGSLTAQTTITDPDGVPGTGDESATALNINPALANTVWTPTFLGPNVEFRQGGAIPTIPAGQAGSSPVTPSGSVFFSLSLAAGLLRANYDCQPGLTDVGGTTFTPSTASPFETVAVTLPPTAPVCTDESVTVVAGQTIPIDLSDNCSDVNGNLDLSTLSVTTAPTAGTLTPAGLGMFSYDAPPAPTTDSFQFTVADTTGLVSNTALVSITVTPAPNKSKCTSLKYKAVGKKALKKLKCLAKAIKAGKSVDPACLQKAEEKFASKWGVAEQLNDCLTIGDEVSVEAQVDSFVDDIKNTLEPVAP